MDFLKNINKNIILIVPYEIKYKILKYIDKNQLLINVKILTFNEFKKGLYYDYSNQAVNHIMNKFNLSYNDAITLINNTYYIDDNDSPVENIKKIIDAKKELETNNLLIYDKLFIDLLKSKEQLMVFGFDYITKFDKHLLELAKNYIDIKIIDKNYEHYNHEVYEFNSMEEEISYIAEEIAKLINEGTPLNKIYLANYDSSYYFTITRIFNDYKIPVYLESDTRLNKTSMGIYFLNNIEKNIENILYKTKKKFDVDNNEYNANIYNKLFALVNTYYWSDNIEKQYNLIESEMSKIKINKEHLQNEITIIDIANNIIDEDEHVFFIGFNSNTPKIYKDEDFLYDDIKPDILETTQEKNIISKDNLLRNIDTIKNITLTYKLSSMFDTYMPSYLTDNYPIIKGKEFISSFSNAQNKLKAATAIDKKIKFNIESDILPTLYHNYDIPYKKYDNQFKGISKNKIKDFVEKQEFVISATTINDFYECPFKFYLNKILHVREYKQTLEQFIGSAYHKVLEESLKKNDADISKIYDDFIKENYEKQNFSAKDLFYINMLKDEIFFVVNTIKKQYTHSKHNKEDYELEKIIEFKEPLKVKLKGYIDKILYLNNQAIIIDYKTNNSTIDKELLEFGLNMQLPIYAYLLKEIDNIDVLGMYLQHILDINLKYEPEKNSTELKEKNMRLDGLTVANLDISKFDDSYDKSVVIKSLSTKDGNIKPNSKIISDDEYQDILKLTDRLIKNVIEKISNADFIIHPVKIANKKDACEYCKYKDICFRKEKDFNEQDYKEDKNEPNS